MTTNKNQDEATAAALADLARLERAAADAREASFEADEKLRQQTNWTRLGSAEPGRFETGHAHPNNPYDLATFEAMVADARLWLAQHGA